jgi:translocation and assembly module TamA
MAVLLKKIAFFLILLSLLSFHVQAEVVLKGIDGKLRENAMLLLSLNQEKCDAPQWKIDRLFAQADAELDKAFRALGYYHAQVEKKLHPAKGSECWLAEFNVKAGEQVSIHAINISITGEGKTDAELVKLTKKFQDKVGAPLDHSFYESIKKRFNLLAQERGYLKARWQEKKLRIDKQHNQAEIKLVLDSGSRYQFGQVTINQKVLSPELVAKYSNVVAETFYSNSLLAETYDALSKSGYFEQVEIRPDFDHPNGQQIPININLTPKDKHHFSVGLGYGTDVGPLVNMAYQNRRINEDGDLLTANLDFSFVLSTLEMEYLTPLDDPRNDFFSFGAGIKRENTDNFTSLSASLSGRLRYALPEAWKQTLFADFTYEKFTLQQQENTSLLFILGANWMQSLSNHPAHPTEGQRLRFDVSGSYETPLSDVSFARAQFDGVWLQPMPWDGIFTGRMSLGAMTVSKFDKLPASYRFYAGGINSVRGYDYKELGGTQDAFGNVKGGKFLTVLSAEYEQTIFDDYAIAAFVDSGNAFNLNDVSLKTGVGLGLRWYSPIGAIRLDFAIPLNEANSGYQIYFAAGTRL